MEYMSAPQAAEKQDISKIPSSKSKNTNQKLLQEEPGHE